MPRTQRVNIRPVHIERSFVLTQHGPSRQIGPGKFRPFATSDLLDAFQVSHPRGPQIGLVRNDGTLEIARAHPKHLNALLATIDAIQRDAIELMPGYVPCDGRDPVGACQGGWAFRHEKPDTNTGNSPVFAKTLFWNDSARRDLIFDSSGGLLWNNTITTGGQRTYAPDGVSGEWESCLHIDGKLGTVFVGDHKVWAIRSVFDALYERMGFKLLGGPSQQNFVRLAAMVFDEQYAGRYAQSAGRDDANALMVVDRHDAFHKLSDLKQLETASLQGLASHYGDLRLVSSAMVHRNDVKVPAFEASWQMREPYVRSIRASRVSRFGHDGHIDVDWPAGATLRSVMDFIGGQPKQQDEAA